VRRALNAQRSRTEAIRRVAAACAKRNVHAEKCPRNSGRAVSRPWPIAVSMNTILPVGLEPTTYGS
jgi:hypothetical protein